MSNEDRHESQHIVERRALIRAACGAAANALRQLERSGVDTYRETDAAAIIAAMDRLQEIVASELVDNAEDPAPTHDASSQLAERPVRSNRTTTAPPDPRAGVADGSTTSESTAAAPRVAGSSDRQSGQLTRASTSDQATAKRLPWDVDAGMADNGQVLAAGIGLDGIRQALDGCTRCALCHGRTNIVFGVGNPSARLMFIGEGPGADEDARGEPFVGRAGALLDRMIVAMGLRREDVYIANVVKCRPPNNRDPELAEVATCMPFLRAQIAAVAPEVIVALGRVAVQALFGDVTIRITSARGTWRALGDIPVMPTLHPAHLLREPSRKRVVWEDLQEVMRRLDTRAAPPRSPEV